MVIELAHERYFLPMREYKLQILWEKSLCAIAKEALKPGNIQKLPGLV